MSVILQVIGLTSLIEDKTIDYLTSLDWPYMITLIIISHFVVDDNILKVKPLSEIKLLTKIRPLLLSVPKAWRVLLIGILYAVIINFVRLENDRLSTEVIIQSLLLTMVSHKLFLDKILKKLK